MTGMVARVAAGVSAVINSVLYPCGFLKEILVFVVTDSLGPVMELLEGQYKLTKKYLHEGEFDKAIAVGERAMADIDTYVTSSPPRTSSDSVFSMTRTSSLRW